MNARSKEFFTFSTEEMGWLGISAVICAFIFSFRDWGDTTFDASLGLFHFMLLILVCLFSLLVRFTAQKMKALSLGYLAEFKIWWTGLVISLALTFVSMGKFSIILVGGVSVAFMVRQRLGEFRYGFSYQQNGEIGFTGIMTNLLLAFVFGIGLYLFPTSYLFEKAMWFNLAMGFFSFIPLIQLDGLSIFFGSREMYFGGLLMFILGSVLIATQSKVGLILFGVVLTIGWIFTTLTQSTK